MDYVSAEISTSKQKKFSLVTFVDTPGLVDGDMIYPFDVNSAITWLGKYLRIYVFSITRVAPQILMHLMLLRRRTGGPDFRLLWPDGSGAVQTDAQHRGEAERQMWRQAVVLSQQSRRSWEGDGQTGQFFIHKSCFNFYPEKALALVFPTESNDADCPGAVPPSRAQQMWFWDADNIHPQPTEGKIQCSCLDLIILLSRSIFKNKSIFWTKMSLGLWWWTGSIILLL